MEEKQEVVETLIEETKPIDVLIEEKRVPLYKEYTTSRKVSNIMTFAILVIAIAGMVLITGQQKWMPILGWCIIAAGVIGMILFYFLSKKKFDENTKDYIAFINETLNKKAFEDKKYKNIQNIPEKLEVNDLASNGVYANIVRVASRNKIKGEFDGIRFTFAEAAIFKKGDKKQTPAVAAFIGKCFEATNDLKFEGNVVINISRAEPVDAPNAIEGRAKLYEQGNVCVYGDEGFNFREVIGEEFFGNFKKIEVTGHLLNLAISIWGGRTFVFMSYDDEVIAMPFDKPLNPEAFNDYVAELKKVFTTVKLLGK